MRRNMSANYEQTKDSVMELDSAHNSYLQIPSLLTSIYRKLLEYSKGLGTNYKNIEKENDCLTFDYLHHKFKIVISISFKNDKHYKTIILSEISKKEGEEKVLNRIYLDKENCIVNF
jgi:hypothetical protein